jgi:hypothetical protein
MTMEIPKYNLFLDDLRTPLDAFAYKRLPVYLNERWEIVRNYADFVAHVLKYGMPNMVSFDHDLADIHYKLCNHGGEIDYDSLEEKTGYDCAKWLVNYCMDLGYLPTPQYIIHTMNPVGGKNIKKLLDNYNKSRNI